MRVRAVLRAQPIELTTSLPPVDVEHRLRAASEPYRPWRLLSEPVEGDRLAGAVAAGHVHLLVRRYEPWRRSATRLIAEIRPDGDGSVVVGRTSVRPLERAGQLLWLVVAAALVVGGLATLEVPAIVAGFLVGAALLGQLTWRGDGVQQDRATVERWLADALST